MSDGQAATDPPSPPAAQKISDEVQWVADHRGSTGLAQSMQQSGFGGMMHLIVSRGFLLIGLGLVLCSGRAFAAGHDDEIEQSLSRMERGSALAKEDAQRRVAAIKVLKEYPQEAIPHMISESRDKNKPMVYRDECVRMLGQKEFKGHLTPAHFQELVGLVEDEKEEPLLRLHGAIAILNNQKSVPEDQSRSIKKMALDLLATQKLRGQVYNLIFRHYSGDPEIENLLLEKLKSDTDKNDALLALGKVRSARALDEIVKLLDSPEAGNSFYKVRAYLAIGDIGGDRAYDYLRRFQKSEKSFLDQDSIFQALARTKTARAKEMLLRRLDSANNDDLVVLDAIKYNGDQSFIPILEKEMLKPKNARNKLDFQKIIEALKKGDDSTPW